MDDSRLKYLQSIKQQLEDIGKEAELAGKKLARVTAADEAAVARGSDPLRDVSRKQVIELVAEAEAKRMAVPSVPWPTREKEAAVQAEKNAIAAFDRYTAYSLEYKKLQSIARDEAVRQRKERDKLRADSSRSLSTASSQQAAVKTSNASAISNNSAFDAAVAKALLIMDRRNAENERRRYGSTAEQRAEFAASLAASRRINNIIYQGNAPITSQREKTVIQQAINTTAVDERRAAAIKSREASYVAPVPTTVSGRNISRRRVANPTRSFTLPEEVAAEIELDISERERQLEIAENRFQRRKYGGPRSERKRKGRFKKTYIENIEQRSEEQYLRYLQAPEGSAEEADARLEHERLYDLAKNLRLGRASINALPTTRGNAYGPTGRYRYNQARPTTRSRPAAVIAPDLQEQLSYVTALAKAITQVSERAEYAASSSEQVSQIEKAKSDALHFLENAASVAANPNVDAKTVGQIVRRFRGHAKAFSANPQFRELHRNFASNITQSGLNPESFEAFVLGLVMDTLDQAKEPAPKAKPPRVPNRARVRVIKGNAELPQVDSVEVFGTDEEAVTGFSTDSGQQQARRRYALVAPFKEQQQREAIVKSMNNTMMVATDQSSGMTTGQVTYESFSSMGNLFQDGRDFVVQQLMQQIVDSVQADITSGRFADLNGKRVPATLAKNATAAVRAVSQMSTMRTFEGRITPYDTDMPLGVKKSPDALKTISQGLAGAMLAHYAEGGEFRDASDIQSFVDKYTSELFDESKTPSVYTAEKLVMSQMDVLRKQRADQASRVARNPSIMQDPEFKKEYLQTKQQLAALETIMQDDDSYDTKTLAMGYDMPTRTLRSDLRSMFPRGTSTAELVSKGVRSATTRRADGYNVGDIVSIPELPGSSFRITAIDKPDFSTPEGIKAWEAKEGWSFDNLPERIKNQVLDDSARQISFTPVSDLSEDEKRLARENRARDRGALLGVNRPLTKEDALKMLAGSALELDPDLMPRPDWVTQAVNFFSGVYGRLRKSGFNAPERLFERPTTLRKQVDVATGVEDKTEQLEQEIQREVDAAATAVAVNNKGQLTVGGSPLAEASRTVPEAFVESIGISSQVATGTGIGSFAKGLLETARRFKKISKNRENKNNKLLEYNNKLLSLQEKLQTADQQEKPVIRQEIARINAELSKLENDSTDSIFGVEGASATQTRDILTASDDMAAAVDRGIPLLDAVMADPTKNFSYKKFTQMFPQLQDFVPDHDTFIKLRKLARQRGKSSPAEIYSQLFDIMRAPVTGRVDSLINNLAAARGEDPRAIRSMYASGGLQAVPDEYKQLFQTTEMFATPVEAFTELQNAAAAKGAPGTVVQMAAAGQLGSEAKNAIEDFERPVTLNSLINSAKYFTRNMITGMQKRVSKAMKGYNINHFDPQQMKEFEALLPTTVSEDRDRPIDPLTHIRAKFVNDRGESLYGEDFTMAVESEIEKARQSLYSSNLTEVEQQGVRSRINNLQKLLDAETPEVQDDSENVQIARNTSRIGRRTLTGVFKSGSTILKRIRSRFARAAQARAEEEAAREAATPRLFNANQVRNLLSEFTLTPSKNQSFIENKGMRLIGQALLKVPLDDLATGESILSALSDVGFTDVGRLSTVENFLNPDSRAFVLNTMNDPKRRAAMERLFDVMGQAQKNLGIDRLTLPNVAVNPETEALFSGTVTPERLEEIYANRKSDAPFASVLPFVSTASLRNPTASSLNDRQVAGMYRLMSVANDLFSIKDALDPDSSLNKAQRQQILREKAAGRYYQGMDTSSDEFKAKFEDDFKKITGMLGISEHAELNKRRLQYEVNLKDRGAVGNTLTFGRSYKDILDLARGTNITTAGQFVTEQLADSNLSTTTSAGEYQTLQGRSGLLRRFLNQFRISRLANQSADLRKLYGDDAIIPNTEANLKLAQEIKDLNEFDRQAYEERLKQARVKRGLPAERVVGGAVVNQAEIDTEPLNVYAGANENTDLSNFAVRPFTYQGRVYNSVEQAYQSLKSGKFIESVYNDPKFVPFERAGIMTVSKPANAPVGDSTEESRAELMEELMSESFRQNPEALQRLLSTGTRPITHTQDKGFWGTMFPKILMSVRDRFSWAKLEKEPATGTGRVESRPPMTPEQKDFLNIPEGYFDDVTLTFAPGEFLAGIRRLQRLDVLKRSFKRSRYSHAGLSNMGYQLDSPLATSELATAGRTVQTVDKLTKDLVEANPDLIYLFGDNLQRTGTAGQATIRHASTKNVVGIPTKKKPATTEDAYFTDSDEDFEIFKKGVDEALASIPAGKTVVLPSAGIGTGLAQLPTRAPRLFAYLQQRLKSLGSPAEAKPSTASKIVSTITKPGVMSAILLAGTTAYSMLTGEDPSAMLGGLMAAGIMGAGGVKLPPKLRKIVEKSAKKIRAAKTEEEIALVETAAELAEKAAEASAAAPVSVVPPVAPTVSKASRLKVLLRAVSDKFRVAPSVARALMDRALASVRPSSIKEAAPIASAVTAPLVDTTTVVEDEATAKERRRIKRRRADAAARLAAGVGDRGVRKRKRPTVVSPATSPEDSTEVPSTTSAEEVTSDDRETRIKNIQAIKAIRIYALKRAELFVKHGLGWDGTPRRVSTYPAEEQKELSILHEDMFKKTEHLDKEKKNAIFKKIFDRETAALLASTTTSTTAAGEPKTSTSTLAKTAVKPMPIGEGPGGGPTPVWIVGQSGALQVTGGGGGGKDSGGTVTTKTKDADGKEVTTTEQAGEFPQVPALVRALLTGLDAYRNTKHMALAKETDPLKIEALQKDITDASRRTLKEVLNKEDMLAATGYAYRDDLDFNTNLENASGSLAERIMANQVLDEDGNPVLDEKGNPVFKPNKAQVTAALTLEKLAQTSRFQTQSMTQRPPTSYAGGGGGVVRDKAGLVYDTSMIRLQAARNAFDQSAGAVIGGTMNEARDFLLRETRAGISGLFGNVPVETITDPLTGTTKRIAQLMDPSAIPAVSTLDTAEVRSATEVLNSQFTDFSSNSGASMEELGSDLSNLVQTIDALSRASMEAKRKITEQIQAEQKRLQELKEDPASSAADVADAEDRLKALRQQELDLDTYSQGINATTKGISMALNQQKQAAGVLDTGSARAIDVFDQQMRAIMTRPGLFAGFGRSRDARNTRAAFARDFVGEEGSKVLMGSNGLVAYTAKGTKVDLAYANTEQLKELQKRLAAKNAPVSMEQLIRLQQTSAQLKQVGNQQPFSDKVFYMAAKIRDYQTLLDTGLQYTLGLPRAVAGAVQNAANPALTAARTMVTAQGLARTPEVYTAALGAASTQQSMFGGSLTSNLGQITSFIPLTNAYGVDINKVTNVARKLAAFDPAQGMEGASIAIKEFLSGNVASLSRRFEINRSALSKINQSDSNTMLDSLNAVLEGMGVTDRLIDEQANSLAAKYDKMLGRLESAEIAISAFLVDKITGPLEWFAGPDSALAKKASEMSLTTVRDERMRFAGDAKLLDSESGLASLDVFSENYYEQLDSVIASANEEILKEAVRYQETTGMAATVSPYRRIGNMSPSQRLQLRMTALEYMQGGMSKGQAQLQALRDIGGDYATYEEFAPQRRLRGSVTPMSNKERSQLFGELTDILNKTALVPMQIVGRYDADTFYVRNLGETEERKLRISGVDAPELSFGKDSSGETRYNPLGKEARDKSKDIVADKEIILVSLQGTDKNNRLLGQAIVEKTGKDLGAELINRGLATVAFTEGSGMDKRSIEIYKRLDEAAADAGIGPVNRDASKLGLGANYGISEEARYRYFMEKYFGGGNLLLGIGSGAASSLAATKLATLSTAGAAAAQAAPIMSALGPLLIGAAVGTGLYTGVSYYLDKNDTSAEKIKELYKIEEKLSKERIKTQQAQSLASRLSKIQGFIPGYYSAEQAGRMAQYYNNRREAILTNPYKTDQEKQESLKALKEEEAARVVEATSYGTPMPEAQFAEFNNAFSAAADKSFEAVEGFYNKETARGKEYYDSEIVSPITGEKMTYFNYATQLKTYFEMGKQYEAVQKLLDGIGEDKLLAPIQGLTLFKDNEKLLETAEKYRFTVDSSRLPSVAATPEYIRYSRMPPTREFTMDSFINASTPDRLSMLQQFQEQLLDAPNFKIQAKEYTNQILEERMQLRQKRFNTVVEANALNALAGLGYSNLGYAPVNAAGGNNQLGYYNTKTGMVTSSINEQERALAMVSNQVIGAGTQQDLPAAQELEVAQRNAVDKLNDMAEAFREQAQATLANTIMYNSSFANLASSITMNSSAFRKVMDVMGQGDPLFAQKYFRQMSGVDFMSVMQNGIVNPFSQTGIMGFSDMRSNVYDAGLGFQFTSGRGGAMQFSNAYTQGPRGAIAFAQDAQSNNVFSQIMNPQQYFQSIIAPAINGQTELARRGIQQGNQMRDLQRQQNYTLEDITRNGMRQLEQIHRTYTRNMYQLALNNEITKRMTRANSYQSILAADISEEDRNSLLAFMAQGEQAIRHAEQGDVTNFLKNTNLTGDDVNALIAAEQAYQATPFTDPDAKEAAQLARMNAAEPVKQRLQALIDAETDPIKKSQYMSQLALLGKDPARAAALEPIYVNEMQRRLGNATLGQSVSYQQQDAAYEAAGRPLRRRVLLKALDDAYKADKKDPVAYALGIEQAEKALDDFDRQAVIADRNLGIAGRQLAATAAAAPLWADAFTVALEAIGNNSSTTLSGLLNDYDDFGRGIRTEIENAAINFERQKLALVTSFGDAMVEIAAQVPPALQTATQAFAEFAAADAQATALMYAGDTQGALDVYAAASSAYAKKMFPDDIKKQKDFEALMNANAPKPINQTSLTGGLSDFAVMTADGPALRVSISEKKVAAPPPPPPTGTGPGGYTGGKPTGTGPFTYNTDEYTAPVKGVKN